MILRVPSRNAADFRWATITEVGDYDLVARLEAKTSLPKGPVTPKFAAGGRGAGADSSSGCGSVSLKMPIMRCPICKQNVDVGRQSVSSLLQ